MKIYKALAWPIAALVCLLPAMVSATDFDNDAIVIDQPTTLMLKEKADVVNVNVLAGVIPESVALPPESTARLPVVTKIGIKVNGQDVFVARSVFADLIDPKRCLVKKMGKEWLLNVVGGDAADTYSVSIYFNARQVLRRLKFAGLNTTHPVEETKYMPLVVIN